MWEQAQAAGVSECTSIARKDIMGHERGDVTESSYVSRDLGWALYVRAVEGVVASGMAPEVRKALEETSSIRPPLPAKVAQPRRPRRARKTPSVDFHRDLTRDFH